MKKGILFGVLIFLLSSIIIVAAVPVNHELTTVSRIVGETADDLTKQLVRDEITIESAAIFSKYGFDGSQIVSSQLPTTSPYPITSYDTKAIFENDKNKMIIAISDTKGTQQESAPFTLDEIRNLDVEDNNFVVLDSTYAGLDVGKESSFVNEFSSKGPYIAPMSKTSQIFLKTLACNVGKHEQIGELFRQARNQYYLGTFERTEFLAATLLSYSLYGTPTLQLKLPGWNTEERSDECADFDKIEETVLQSAEGYNILETEDETFTQEITIDLGTPVTTDFDNYTTLKTENSQLRYIEDDLILPAKISLTTFPQKTVITKTDLIEFTNPEEITVTNLPSWKENQFIERECYAQMRQPTAEFSQTYTEDEVIIATEIKPVEVIDCEKGIFKVYKQAKYSITYLPYSSLLITAIENPSEIPPEFTTSIKLTTENKENTPAQGILAIKQGTQTISTLNITGTQNEYELEITSPEQEGIYTYTAEFVQENQTKTAKQFNIEVKTLDARLEIPQTSTTSADVKLKITNNLQSTLPITINDYLTKNGQNVQSNSQQINLQPGLNEITLTYTNLQRDSEGYELTVNMPYLSTNTILQGTIPTNQPPKIAASQIQITESETITYQPTVTDDNQDQITTTILNTPFPLDGTYTTTHEDSGTYDILVEATDGIETVQKTIQLVIENTNRPPTLTVEETLNAKEGIELTLTPTTTDPDNENNVNNDDNELTILYGTPFDSEGKWTPEHDSPEQITVPVTVTDGEYEDTKTITINIENVNRPPTILTSEQINAKEAEEISVTAIAIDPDNENVYTHDDNELTFTYGTPFNTEGKWTPDYTSERTMQTTITVSDGEYQDSKTITIDVNNTNRPPTIQELTTTATEGQSVTLTPTITDPDNEDNQPNDDNTLTILYETPFDGNGTYTPDYDSPQQITTTITVTDGELNNTNAATINIQNTNRPPHLDALTDITINETQTVNAWLAKDPDNENTYAHDDNELTYRFYNVPLDNKGKWQTTYDNAGEYVVKVEANDGQYGITKEVKLIVTNVNRPPIITAPDQIMATKTADLSKYVTDPDNQNTATNDDNILKITYGPPFDTNGQWSPTQPTTAQTTITATDGTHTVQKTVYVTILDTISPPTQTPPIEQITQQNDTQELPEVEITPEEEPVTIEEQNNTQAQNNTETPQEIEQNHIFITNAQQPIIATEQPQDDLQVKININGKQTNTEDTIKIKPEKDLKIKIDLENKAQQTKNIEITTEINNLDIEEQDNTKLETGETDKITQTIEIPRLTEKHEYPLTIFVNDDKTRTWNILLKIDKPTHEIKIRQFTVQEGYCDAEIKLKIENTGKNDEEVKITLLEEPIETELEEGETRTISKTLTKPGKYEIEAKIEYGKKELTETKTLELKPCTAETTTKTQAPPQEKSQTNLPIIHSTQTETIATKDIASITFITLLTVFTGLLLAIAINKYQ